MADKRPASWVYEPCKKPRLLDNNNCDHVPSECDSEIGEFCSPDEPQTVDTVAEDNPNEHIRTREPLPLDESKREEEIVCHVSNCRKVFDSISSYEFHYASSHVFVCSVCRRKLASNHLLDLHLLEWHDTGFQLLALSRPMYECLEVGCGEKFKNPASRKDHIVCVHKYPGSFNFNKPAQDKPGKQNKSKPKGSVKGKNQRISQSKANGDQPSSSTQPESCGSRLAHPARTPDVDGRLTEEGRVCDSARCDLTTEAMATTLENDGSVCDSAGSEEKSAAIVTTPHNTTSAAVCDSAKSSLTTDAMETPTPNTISAEPTTTPKRRYNYKVPTNVCFGAGSQRGFHRPRGRGRAKHWHQQQHDAMETSVDIEHVTMNDLADALE